MMMKKKTATRTTVRKRAWRLIRVALIWARKGGAFKQSLLLSLKLGFKNITNHHHHQHQKRLHNFEREFSFNETPSFRFKLHRPRIPCIDFHDDDHEQDYDDDDDDAVVFFNRYGSYDHHNKDDEDDHNIQEEEEQQNDDDDDDEEELMEIDSKAEEFIAKFYQDMKLQRQAMATEDIGGEEMEGSGAAGGIAGASNEKRGQTREEEGGREEP